MRNKIQRSSPIANNFSVVTESNQTNFSLGVSLNHFFNLRNYGFFYCIYSFPKHAVRNINAIDYWDIICRSITWCHLFHLLLWISFSLRNRILISNLRGLRLVFRTYFNGILVVAKFTSPDIIFLSLTYLTKFI